MNISDDYFAGLFDGEGCVSMRLDNKGCMTLAVGIQMCARDPVFALYKKYGGTFDDGKSSTELGSRIYRWSVSNAGSVACLRILAEKCINKKPACVAALKVAELMEANTRRQPLSLEEKLVRLECMNVVLEANSRGGKKTVMPQSKIDKFLSEKNFGRKKVALSDGRVFESMRAAAKELNVTTGAIWHGVNGGYPVKGFRVYNA